MIKSVETSQISLINARRAFSETKIQSHPKEATPVDIPTEEEHNVLDNRLMKGKNITEIMEYAQKMGERINEDDIKYGLAYGRSVIADYSV